MSWHRLPALPGNQYKQILGDCQSARPQRADICIKVKPKTRSAWHLPTKMENWKAGLATSYFSFVFSLYPFPSFPEHMDTHLFLPFLFFPFPLPRSLLLFSSSYPPSPSPFILGKMRSRPFHKGVITGQDLSSPFCV